MLDGHPARFFVGSPWARDSLGWPVGLVYVYDDPEPGALMSPAEVLGRPGSWVGAPCDAAPGDQFGAVLAVGELHVQGTDIASLRVHLAIGAPAAANDCQGGLMRRSGEVSIYEIPSTSPALLLLQHVAVNPQPFTGPPMGQFGAAITFLKRATYRFELTEDLVTATLYPQGQAELLVGDPTAHDIIAGTRPGLVWGLEVSGPSTPSTRIIRQGLP